MCSLMEVWDNYTHLVELEAAQKKMKKQGITNKQNGSNHRMKIRDAALKGMSAGNGFDSLPPTPSTSAQTQPSDVIVMLKMKIPNIDHSRTTNQNI